MGEELRYTGNECLEKTWDTTAPHDACRKASEAELQSNNAHRDWLQNIVWYQFGVALDWDGTNPSNLEEFDGSEIRQGICPDGWHIPSVYEFWESKYYVGVPTSGTVFKAKPLIWNGTDDYGYTALPTGYRGNNGALSYVGTLSMWCGNFYYDGGSWGHYFDSNYEQLMYSEGSLSFGKVVRCVFVK